LSAAIDEALDRHGFAAETAVLLSPLGEAKGRRCAYRVQNREGEVLKVRLFENAEEARRVFDLRAGLEPAFAPALACHGSVLVEEWIEGVPLAEAGWEPWVEPAGALLGRLHARPLPARQPSRMSTQKWFRGANADLDLLTAAGILDWHHADRLRQELSRRDPGSGAAALIHTDFCADNMLIDKLGRLRVIDNEGLAVRPASFDLARTFQLWPMSKDTWVRFRRGYVSAAAAAPEATGFWRIVAVLMGARIFLKLSPARLQASLSLLQQFLAGEHLSDTE
jgi:thiamine kinase-like enzyme